VNKVVLAERDIERRRLYHETLQTYEKPIHREKVRPHKKGRYILVLALVALMAIILLSRFSMITESQYRIEKLKNELKNIEEQNQRLKVEVANLKSVARIEDIAKNKLNMIEPDSHQIVYLNEN
jgi:cell division protein FtsL